MSDPKPRQITVNGNSIKASSWQRHALLAISIGLTAGGLILGFSTESASHEFAQGVLLKTGIVTFMWWLALPQLRKLNPIVVGITAVLALVAIVRPQLLLLMAKVALPLAPILFLLWLFWRLKRP